MSSEFEKQGKIKLPKAIRDKLTLRNAAIGSGTGLAGAIAAWFAARKKTMDTRYPPVQKWWERLDPVTKDTILGSGAGAITGTGLTALKPKDEDDLRSPSARLLDNVLLGATAGGATGYGVGKIRS